MGAPPVRLGFGLFKYPFLFIFFFSFKILSTQERVAHSSAEAEYILASEATKQVVWLRKILEDMGGKQDMATVIFCDNKSAISMAKNSEFHSRTKHTKLKHHYIKEVVEDEEIVIKHVKTGDQLADIFTKALPCDRFVYLRELLRMMKFG